MPYVDIDPRLPRRRLTGLGWLCIPGLASPAAAIAAWGASSHPTLLNTYCAVYSGMWLAATVVGWIYRAGNSSGARLLTGSSRKDLEHEVAKLKVSFRDALKLYEDESARAARIAEAVVEAKPLPAPEPAPERPVRPTFEELVLRVGSLPVTGLASAESPPNWRWVIGPDGTRTLENSAATVVPAPAIPQLPAGVVNIGVVNQYFGISNPRPAHVSGMPSINTCGVSFVSPRTGS